MFCFFNRGYNLKQKNTIFKSLKEKMVLANKTMFPSVSTIQKIRKMY